MPHYSTWKFTLLLISLLLLVAARLASSGALQSQIAIDVIGAIVIIAGMLAACTEKRYRAAALVLAIPAAVLTVAADALPDKLSHSAFLATRILSTLALGLVVVLIIRALLAERNVSKDTIAGAFCGYLLIGTVWTEVYCMLALASSTAFAGVAARPEILSHPVQRWHTLQYFSFATLTAATYGDIVPNSPPAQALALMEAICGQFYLVMLVSVLVGMHVAALTSRQSPPADRKA